ncbi:TonB-dependent receptor [Leptospira langatensis]|uniref:TonB-dependent receptor n=1 Tax=Leptospira langatensis TaxID=2484983 RepID=A0A5F1ZRM5_9LEPT|nr:TonB-dependent receptor [Leptospira langatensis]TGJ98856.1 TonB-dependent receptor [Leptospira langatensis]TGL40577.1 TonB-dependent receptor [Leptospira langatensis]
MRRIPNSSPSRILYLLLFSILCLSGVPLFAETDMVPEKTTDEKQEKEKQKGSSDSNTASETINGNGTANDKGSIITITGTRRKGLLKDSTITTEVITRKDIDAMGARDLSNTLGNVPGIEVRPAQAGERGATVRLQGLSGQNVLILVDGQRTTGRFSGSIDLTRFKAEDIERIEIVKGASSALYGSDAIAGVINIVTKDQKEPYSSNFRTFAGGGNPLYYGTGLEFRNYASVGVRKGIVSTQFTAGWHRGDGYDLTPDATLGPKNGRIESLSPNYSPFPTNMPLSTKILIAKKHLPYTPPLESTSGSAFEDLNVSNKTTFDISEALKVGFQFYYRYLNQSAVDASLPNTVYDRSNKTHDFMGALNADWELTKNLNLNVNANYARFFDTYTLDQRQSDALDKREKLDNAVTEFRTRLDHKISEGHVISYGAETLIDQLSSARIAPDCKRNFPYVCVDDLLGISDTYQTRNGYAERQRTAFYVQDEWRISNAPRIQIVPGLRSDHDSIYGGQTLPKLAVRLDVTDKFKIRAANGLGYRAPSFQDLYYNFINPGVGYRVAGNPDLKPELSRSYNIGGEWEPNRRFWFSFNFFYNNVDNLIGFRTNPNRDASGLIIYSTSNFQKALSKGFESSFTIRVHQNISLGGGYTYTDTKDELTDLPLEGRGYHRWNANIRLDHPSSGFSFSLFAVVFGKQPYYCQKNPLWCDPQLSSDYSAITSLLQANTNHLIQDLFGSIPQGIQDYCTERNLSYCTSAPTYGVRMVNPHTNLNIRVSQKILGAFEFFAGVDNLLDTFDLTYNPQKPRFYYVGIDGKFSGMDPSVAYSK